MKDTRIIEQVCEAFVNFNTDEGGVLDGFDPGLVGFNCIDAIDCTEPWACPFQPGCGAKNLNDCPEAKRRAQILAAPRRQQ